MSREAHATATTYYIRIELLLVALKPATTLHDENVTEDKMLLLNPIGVPSPLTSVLESDKRVTSFRQYS